MKSHPTCRIVCTTFFTLTAIVSLASLGHADDLYTDSFSGSGALNGSLVEGGALQTGSLAWSANSAFNANGTINGADEGSALLPFQPLVDSVYTVSIDVTNTTDRWIALGFARDPLGSAGVSSLDDRLSNEAEGIAWMLYRNNGAANAVESFSGLRTDGGSALDTSSLDFNVANEMEIIIDTTGDGSSFNTDWRINGISLRNETVNIAVSDINYVGLSFDNDTTGVPLFDNFLLTGPVTLFGDVDGDGDVDLIDFGFIRDNLFLSGATRLQGDLSGDGVVDFADYREWKDNAGALGVGVSLTIPEPTAMALLALAGAFPLVARRRD